MEMLTEGQLKYLIQVPFAFVFLVLAYIFYMAHLKITNLIKRLIDLIEKLVSEDKKEGP